MIKVYSETHLHMLMLIIENSNHIWSPLNLICIFTDNCDYNYDQFTRILTVFHSEDLCHTGICHLFQHGWRETEAGHGGGQTSLREEDGQENHRQWGAGHRTAQVRPGGGN